MNHGVDSPTGKIPGKIRVSNPDLKKRFGALYEKHGDPMIVLLRRGKYYLASPLMTPEELEEFALGGYEKAEVQGPIPLPATVFDKAWEGSLDLLEKSGDYFNKFLVVNQETGQVNYAMFAVFFGVPALLVVIVLVKAFSKKPDVETVPIEKKPVVATPSKQPSKQGKVTSQKKNK